MAGVVGVRLLPPYSGPLYRYLNGGSLPTRERGLLIRGRMPGSGAGVAYLPGGTPSERCWRLSSTPTSGQVLLAHGTRLVATSRLLLVSLRRNGGIIPCRLDDGPPKLPGDTPAQRAQNERVSFRCVSHNPRCSEQKGVLAVQRHVGLAVGPSIGDGE